MMKPTSKSNPSELLRQLKALTTGPNSMYRRADSTLKDMLLEEFDVLVRETPQWTGTTAASWQIGFQSEVTTDVEEQPERSLAEALQKGSEAACSIAMAKARTTITGNFDKYKTQDIWITNEAPGYERAEEGPVRAVNTPPGALKRFEARLATRPDIEIDTSK